MLSKIASFVFCLFPLMSHAISVGDVTSFINPKVDHIAKEIKNNSSQARLITVEVQRISSPEEGGEEIPMEADGEVMVTPTRIILPANGKNNVRFFYRGPADDKERYYRIMWHDSALSAGQEQSGSRQAMATVSAKIGSLLVVSPRKDHFDYAFDKQELINKGNLSYQAVAYGACLDKSQKEQCKETYYDLPGKQRIFKKVDLKNTESHLVIWLDERYIAVK